MAEKVESAAKALLEAAAETPKDEGQPLTWQEKTQKWSVVGASILVVLAVSVFLQDRFEDLIHSYFRCEYGHNREDNMGCRKKTALMETISLFVKILIWVVTAFIVLNILGVDTFSLVAVAGTLGVGGLVAALAVQNMLKDMILGFVIVWQQQLAEGDVVNVMMTNGKTVDGRVRNLGVRSLEILGFDGVVHFLGYGSIEVISNMSVESLRISVQVDVPIYYTDEAIRIIKSKGETFVSGLEGTFPKNGASLSVWSDSLSRDMATIKAVAYTEVTNKWSYERGLRLKVTEWLKAAGIPVLVPHPRMVVTNM
jgi:moderate conductance mechanosensitive channel